MSASISKDNIFIKRYRSLVTIGKAIFVFLKGVACFLVGTILMLISYQLLAGIFRNWDWSSILITSVYVIILTIIFIIGSVFVLIPFRKWKLITHMIKILIMPLAWFLKLGNYYLGLAAIYFELLSLAAIGLIVFSGLRNIHPFHALNERVGYYLVFTLSILIFTFGGQKMTEALLKGKKHEDFAWIINRMQPSIIRFVVYSIAALLYIIANIELFSGLVIFPWSWWIALKEVIVQVFLTYVAIDGTLVAWRDHKELVKAVLNVGGPKK